MPEIHALPNDTCVTAVRTLTLALARTLAPCSTSHPSLTTSWYRPLHCQQVKNHAWPGNVRVYVTTNTSSQLFGLLLLLEKKYSAVRIHMHESLGN
jgi:hypothetical protein